MLETGERHALLIGDAWYETRKEALPVINPASGETIAELPVADDADIDAALLAVEAGQARWSGMSAYERSAILREAARILRERCTGIARTVTREQGKPLAEARIEVSIAADILDWCAEEGRRAYGRVIPGRNEHMRLTVLREPIGPAALFTPWNAPALMPARKLGEALAAGCACIIKPAQEAPGAAVAICRALTDAGVPAGAVNLLLGKTARISERLVSAPSIRKISFTGSTFVGRLMGKLAGEHLKPITLELGGHAPVMVFEDADIQKAATLSAAAKIRNAGQLCGSPSRFLIAQPVYDEFVALFARALEQFVVGDGQVTGTNMGPLSNGRRIVAMEQLVASARNSGAEIVTGGARRAGPGFFFPPTLVRDVTAECLLMNEEPFGPICAAMPFSGVDDAIAEANRLPYALVANAFTRDAATAHAVQTRVQAGAIGINTYAVTGPETPFGGLRDSGYGTEGGSEGVSGYLATKFVAQDFTP